MKPESSLDDWLEYLERLHPESIDLGLERVTAVADRLGVRATNARTVTVAGTNGKGSCVAALDSLLRTGGDRTGVYTSPHLVNFNERIAIDGEPVADAEIVSAFEAIEAARSDISLSYFEFSTLAALWLFKRAGVAWQILEVGLGGRLDAVNCVDAEACVITSIGLDHTEWLGETRDLIAPEKAGVARPDCPAVVAETDLPVTLLPALTALGARSVVINRDWTLEGSTVTLPAGNSITLPPLNGLQPTNVAAAVVVLDQLGCDISQAWVDEALSCLSLSGRQQRELIAGREVWFDVAHNRESVQALVRRINAEPCTGTRHAVFAVMGDKPLHDMILLMAPLIDCWHLPACQGVARAVLPEYLATLIPGGAVFQYDDSEAAARGVMAKTRPGDQIIVLGSFVTVGAQLQALPAIAAETE